MPRACKALSLFVLPHRTFPPATTPLPRTNGFPPLLQLVTSSSFVFDAALSFSLLFRYALFLSTSRSLIFSLILSLLELPSHTITSSVPLPSFPSRVSSHLTVPSLSAPRSIAHPIPFFVFLFPRSPCTLTSSFFLPCSPDPRLFVSPLNHSLSFQQHAT